MNEQMTPDCNQDEYEVARSMEGTNRSFLWLTTGHNNPLIVYLRRNKKGRILAIIIFASLTILLFLGLGYWCWLIALPSLWSWGFTPLSFRAILSLFGAFYLLAIPIVVASIPAAYTFSIVNLYFSDEDVKIAESIREFRDTLSVTESELAEDDDPGLIPLIKYSREQLEAYYAIGLSQTQRSFRYSIIAMWIGFFIIIGGLLQHIVPLERLGISAPTSDINLLVISGGAIIELISALFLWVYRSSISQLTYFYNRQLHTHNVVMCYKIADKMKETSSSDSAKKVIVEKVLERIWTPERVPPPNSDGITSLLTRKNNGTKVM